MDSKTLEILLEIQNDLNEIHKRLNRVEFKIDDGFETLEILSEDTCTEITKLNVKVTKVENKLKEINIRN